MCALSGIVLLAGLAVTTSTPAAPADPGIVAGSVATVVVTLPAPDGVDSASYELRLEPGFRPLIPEAGRVGPVDGLFIIVVPFATPRRLPAGEVEAGMLSVRIGDNRPVERRLSVRVRQRREVKVALQSEDVLVTPDGEADVHYTVRNRGNVEDTVFVAVRRSGPWLTSNPPPIVVPPGGERIGSIRITAPSTANPGDRELFILTTRHGEVEKTHVFHAAIVSDPGWLGSLAHVPSRLFVGHALDAGASPVLTLTGAGRVGPETGIRYELRHWEPGFMEPSLQRQLGGPRLRLELERPGLRAMAGDVSGYRTTISGNLRPFRGVRLEGDPGERVTGRLMAGLPIEFDGSLSGGHNVQAEAGVRTGLGTVSLLAGDLLEPERSGIPSYRSSGAGLRWDASHGAHGGSLEAAVVRLASGDSTLHVGPALDASYVLRGSPVNGRIRFRSVPGAATASGGMGNELSGAFTARLRPSLHLVAWGHRTEQRIAAPDLHHRADAVSLGLRGHTGPYQLHLGTTWSARDRRRNGTVASMDRRALRAEGSYRHGNWSVQADGELGTASELGHHGGFTSVGGGARWHNGPSWGWLRVLHTDRPGDLPSTRAIHAGGAHALGPVTLSGGATVTAMASATTTSFWSAAEIQVQRATSLHLGASSRPVGGDPEWTFSIGVSRRLSMPLPVARQPDLRGVVFDDANNNGRLDPGETVLEGVTVTMGHLRTRTDEHGRFAFRDVPAATPTVPATGLPTGFVLSPRAELRSRGTLEIPLVRTATLELQTFLDRNEDGRWDPGEEAGAGVEITVTGEDGRQRTAMANREGQARISGLLPGRYTITARPPGERKVPGRDPIVLMELELTPGVTSTHTLPVPVRSRTIRMGPGSEGFQSF